MGLKDLLTRVVSGLARAAERPPARERPADEPIPTRSMAELYVQQGHLERAEAILLSLDGEDAALRLREVLRLQARRRLEDALRASPEDGLTVTRDAELLAVAWAISEDRAAGARRLVPDGALTLRLVTIAAREDRADRRVDDRPVADQGAEILEVEPGASVVVAIGLSGASGFVSIVHERAE